MLMRGAVYPDAGGSHPMLRRRRGLLLRRHQRHSELLQGWETGKITHSRLRPRITRANDSSLAPSLPPFLPADLRKVFEYRDSGCFGELAIMYNAPRAATCKVHLRADMVKSFSKLDRTKATFPLLVG